MNKNDAYRRVAISRKQEKMCRKLRDNEVRSMGQGGEAILLQSPHSLLFDPVLSSLKDIRI